jgi:hypothetical protein
VHTESKAQTVQLQENSLNRTLSKNNYILPRFPNEDRTESLTETITNQATSLKSLIQQ